MGERSLDATARNPQSDNQCTCIVLACTMWCLIAVHARLFIWGGNVALHGLITHCTLINFRKCGLHGGFFGSLFIILCRPYIFLQAYSFFPWVIQDFLSFGYYDALKYGLARTVKVFRNGARTSLLLYTGVPSMQTWPIIRNERRFQLLH